MRHRTSVLLPLLLPVLLPLLACGGPSHPAETPPAPAASASGSPPATPVAQATAPSDPAYKADIQTICDAPHWLASTGLNTALLDPSQKARVMAEHVAESLRTDAGRASWKLAVGKDSTMPAERARRMTEAATAQGIAPCAFAQWYLAPP